MAVPYNWAVRAKGGTDGKLSYLSLRKFSFVLSGQISKWEAGGGGSECIYRKREMHLMI